MYYFTEGYARRPWMRDEAEEDLEELPLICTKKDPYLFFKLWQRWVQKRFYQGVVFKFFDLGDLAFCPDRKAEQGWKDRFGKRGILRYFRPSFGGGVWDGFWTSVGVQSRKYLTRAEGILEEAASSLPEEQAYPFRDAMEYGWISEFEEDFKALLTQDLWEAGVVRRDDPQSLDPKHEVAAWRMLEKEFSGQASLLCGAAR